MLIVIHTFIDKVFDTESVIQQLFASSISFHFFLETRIFPQLLKFGFLAAATKGGSVEVNLQILFP
jgi:hypothetical protein